MLLLQLNIGISLPFPDLCNSAEIPLIRDVNVGNALSEEGVGQKIITFTFNASGRAPHPEEDVSSIPRY